VSQLRLRFLKREGEMEFKRVTCIGAGLVGHGWATLFATRGREVVLYDMSETLLAEALQAIKQNLKFLETHELIGKGEAGAALARIKITTDMDRAVSRADYIQESVPDDYDIKKSVFRELDRESPAKAILASSASGLLMTEIQKEVTKPDRCLLVHPLLPVHLIPCVELAGGRQTSQQTLESVFKFMQKLGKSPVLLNREVPGYIVNRLQAALLREAMDLVDKGVASAEDVDNAFRMGVGLRDPIIGPLLRVHLAGNGIERFIQNYSRSYQNRWESMEAWTSIPPSAAEAVKKGIRAMKIVRHKTMDEIKRLRDEKLVQILKIVNQDSLR